MRKLAATSDAEIPEEVLKDLFIMALLEKYQPVAVMKKDKTITSERSSPCFTS